MKEFNGPIIAGPVGEVSEGESVKRRLKAGISDQRILIDRASSFRRRIRKKEIESKTLGDRLRAQEGVSEGESVKRRLKDPTPSHRAPPPAKFSFRRRIRKKEIERYQSLVIPVSVSGFQKENP